MNYHHWSLIRDEYEIAWATLDQAGVNTNTLTSAVIDELSLLLDSLDQNRPRGLVIRSGKSTGYIAGADIAEFTGLATPEAARTLIEKGWTLMERVAATAYPTLALIRGHCFGGGLELALACTYRIAVDEPGTRMALPEVMLGIVPGWGGMKRLPATIGPSAALDLMLTGRQVDARKAKKLGLVDQTTPPRLMQTAAQSLIGSGQARQRLRPWPKLLNGPLKSIVAGQARKQVNRRARPEHYPAPYAIIDLWQHHGGNPLAAPAIIDRLFSSPTTGNLIRLFFLQNRLKSFGPELATPIHHIHVVGAGIMGGEIAAWCALRGLKTTVQDQSLEKVAAAIGRADVLFSRRAKDRLARQAVSDRLIADPLGHGAAHADIVIEAIFEDREAKRKLLAELETKIRQDAVLATNTSSLRLEDLASALREPARLIGIHFFNPVAKMPLVEIVETAASDRRIVERACAFIRAIDKLPLPVKSAPGFLVNAVLAPYLLEAMHCIDAGITPEVIDTALERFGMPMGPIELADTVGLDIVLAAGKQLTDSKPPHCLLEHIKSGNLGKKTGRGFYTYRRNKPEKSPPGPIPDGLAIRMVQPMIERAQTLVDAGVVADSDLADAGVVFGTGFAPFTGGPLHFAATQRSALKMFQTPS